mgnify:CR=1 FL=1
MNDVGKKPRCAVVFGSSGGIGGALCHALEADGVERIFAGSRIGDAAPGGRITPFHFDLGEETSINDEIDRLRLRATKVLFERRDVLIVASVSSSFATTPASTARL